MWYITRLANRHGFTLAGLMKVNMAKLTARHGTRAK